jgi:phosphate:Na+ symporter
VDRLFAGQLIHWISQLTENRLKAFGCGITVGALAPSSTALSLISLQMINTGQLSAERMLAVLLGSGVGITVTVQLLAFHIQDYAGLFVFVGVIAFQFFQREIFRGVGQCLLALGFIFLSMRLIGQAAAVWVNAPETNAWLSLLEGHPLILLVFIAILTVAVQSSTATVGLALAFAGSGLVSQPLVIPWILGASLGIGLTGLLAGWPTIEGRRLGVANLLAKGLVALPFLLFSDVANGFFALMPGSFLREIAMFHTGYNLLVGLVALPLLGPIVRGVRWLIVPPPAREHLPEIESYLDPQALETPSLALANATRETLQMADGVKMMLNHFWRGYASRNLNLMLQVQQEDDRVDDTYRRIKNYLSLLREGLTQEEARWQFALLTFSNELEAVGDTIDKILCDALRKMIAEGTAFTPEDEQAVAQLYEKVLARFDVAVGLLTSRGGSQAKAFIAGKESLNEWCRQAQKEHYERLRHADAQAVAASAFFMDFMNSFRRINSHISTIGYAFQTNGRRKTRPAVEGAKDGGEW